MNAQDCPETLRRYLEVSTGRLRFRSGAVTFSFWVGLLLFGAVAVIALVSAIVSQAERRASIELFVIFGAVVALWLSATFCRWTELERGDGSWSIQSGFMRWRSRPVRVRDADVMTVFVRTTSSWPDFDKVTSLKIDFHALPFAGAPAPVEILKGYGVPKLDLAHLGKLFEDFAHQAQPK